MKQKQRVPKGEKYWFINENFDAEYDYEQYALCDDSRFDSGNYFATEAEVNTMVTKLRAVLKGADVIEMPNGEELIAARKSSCPYPEDYGMMPRAFRQGWDDCFNWMNDKIVK